MRYSGIALIFAMFVTVLVAAAQPVTAAARNPVIFVHGYQGNSSNFDQMIADFQAAGYTDTELLAWEYDSTQSNEATAQELAAAVENMLAETGASQVDIVTHSMGGLNTRWYLKFLDGTGQTDDWVSLGGPNHGTNTAYLCGYQSCVDMRPGSAFLTELNSGDETPGQVDYGTFRSPCDYVINPDSSVKLDGADNTEVACISHSELVTNDAVVQQVIDFVA